MPTSISTFGFTNEDLVIALYAEMGFENILEGLNDVTLGSDGLTERQRTVKQFIRDAEQTIIIRMPMFNPTDMVDDPWVESRTTWIAAHYISRRMGQEHYFHDLYDEAITEVNAIATGEIPVPVNIPLRSMAIPAMSNYTIDDRFATSKLRVRSTISVGGTYAGQDVSYTGGFLWGWL